MLKNLAIAAALGLLAFLVNGAIAGGTLRIPATPGAVAELLVLIAAIFVGMLLTGPRAAAGEDTSATESGTVKWFNVKKGYGFITRDAGDDVFVHYRNIEGESRRGISEGQRVSFVVVPGDKGPQAEQVHAL